MVRRLIVFVLLMGVTVPVWAQDEPGTMIYDPESGRFWSADLSRFPPCEDEELRRYTDSLSPAFAHVYGMLADNQVSITSREGIDAYISFRDLTGRGYNLPNIPLNVPLPPCAEAIELYSRVHRFLPETLLAVSLYLQGAKAAGDRLVTFVTADAYAIYELLGGEPTTAVKTITVNDPVWDAPDAEEQLVGMVVSDNENCYSYIGWGRDQDDGLAERMKWRQRFINDCI